MYRRLRNRIVVIATMLLLTLAVGTAGFMLIEGYPLFDAFYMTLITITTVGYQEVHPLNTAGRVFNSFLILFGVSAMFFAVGAITQSVIELELQDKYGSRRVRKAIMQLKDHCIICGYGRVGRHAAQELAKAGVPFLVIDRNEDRVHAAMEAGMLAALADSTRDETLREAGIARARGFIAALATDADNVFVVLSAKTLNPNLTIVTRASEEDAEQKLRRAGADIVFSPYSMVGNRLAQSILRPRVVQFLDFASQPMGLDVGVEQIRVEVGTALAGHPLGDMTIGRELGVMVLAVCKADGKMLFNPVADTLLEGGDYLIAMGEQPGLRKLEAMLTKAPANRA